MALLFFGEFSDNDCMQEDVMINPGSAIVLGVLLLGATNVSAQSRAAAARRSLPAVTQPSASGVRSTTVQRGSRNDEDWSRDDRYRERDDRFDRDDRRDRGRQYGQYDRFRTGGTRSIDPGITLGYEQYRNPRVDHRGQDIRYNPVPLPRNPTSRGTIGTPRR